MRDRRDELVLRPAERFGDTARRLLALERRGALAFGVALGGHVAEDDDDALKRAVGGTDGGGAVADRDVAAVPGQQYGVAGQRHVLVRRGSRQGARRRPARALVHGLEHDVDGLTDGFRLRPSGQRLGHRVEHRHTAAGVGGNHRVRDAAQRDGEAGLVALARGSRRLLALERALELGHRLGAPGFRHVALAQPLIEDAAASRKPLAKSLNSSTTLPAGTTGSPRASARAATPPWSVRGPRGG